MGGGAVIKLVVGWACLLGLSGVFLYAGVTKALDPAGFAHEVAAYRLTPHALSTFAALYLPAFEILCALALFWRPWRLPALLRLGGLLVFFTGAIASAWLRGLNIACGCFGGSAETGEYLGPILRDLGLIAMTVAAAWCLRTEPAIGPSEAPGWSPVPNRGSS
ncbi:MAG: MauE/DoxX family redox-associated membrane protein [Opitutales bacterium]